MTKRILVVKENRVGEYELRGEKYSSFIILDLDKLDVFSKDLIVRKKLHQLWADENDTTLDDIEPLNGKDWSFDDIQECFHCVGYGSMKEEFDIEKNIRGFERETHELDLSKDKDLKTFHNVIENVKAEQKHGSTFESRFVENILTEFFTSKEIKDAIINNQIDLQIKNEIMITINKEDSFKTESSSSVNLGRYY